MLRGLVGGGVGGGVGIGVGVGVGLGEGVGGVGVGGAGVRLHAKVTNPKKNKRIILTKHNFFIIPSCKIYTSMYLISLRFKKLR